MEITTKFLQDVINALSAGEFHTGAAQDARHEVMSQIRVIIADVNKKAKEDKEAKEAKEGK